jgi:3-oxoacid CoA-transferase
MLSIQHLEQLYLTGKVAVELTPQGTLAERCRAGAAGIPAFFTPTGFGTAVQSGGIPIKFKNDGSGQIEIPGKPREVREFNGKNYIMEEAIIGDVAFVRVNKADEFGNCQFRQGISRGGKFFHVEVLYMDRYSAQNFSGAFARSARLTIVEAEEIVPVGALDPNHVHLPGI